MTLHKFADNSVAGRQFGRPLPSYMPPPGKPVPSNNVHIISSFDEELDFFNSGHTMADTDTSMPYIKNEPDDHSNNPNQYMMPSHSYAIPAQQFGQCSNPQGNEGIDPSELTMQNGSGNFYSFGGSQQNLSSSFNMGGAGIADDELLDLGDLNDQGNQGPRQNMQSNISGYYPNQRQPTGISMSHQGQMTNVYSHTPEGAPIQSPFTGEFDYNQFRPMGQQFPQAPTGSAQFNQNYIHNTKARQLQTGMERKTSDTRSPMTPKTPAMNALNLGSPDSGSFQSQPIRAPLHNKQLSGAWNSSSSPYVDSPLSSPGNPSHHAASMSEILKSGKHASLPNTTSSKPTSQEESQEAKRKRRRASHNMVERAHTRSLPPCPSTSPRRR